MGWPFAGAFLNAPLPSASGASVASAVGDDAASYESDSSCLEEGAAAEAANDDDDDDGMPALEPPAATTTAPGSGAETPAHPHSHTPPHGRSIETALSRSLSKLTVRRDTVVAPAPPQPVPKADIAVGPQFAGNVIKSTRTSSQRESVASSPRSVAPDAPSGPPPGSLRARVLQILGRTDYILVIVALTIFILFIDDLMTVAAPLETPPIAALYMTINVLKFLIFLVFLTELSVLIWIHGRKYIYSLFFVLDLLALISFIPDLMYLFAGISPFSLIGALAIARMGRAARAASRTVAVARLSKEGNNNFIDDFTRISGVASGSLGSDLLNVMASKMTAVALAVFVITALVAVDPDILSHSHGAVATIEAGCNTGNMTLVNDVLVPAFVSGYQARELRILRLRCYSTDLVGSIRSVYRISSKYLLTVRTPTGSTLMVLSIKSEARLEAGLNIAVIIGMLFALILGSVLVSRDSNNLIEVAIAQITGALNSMYAGMLDSQRRPATFAGNGPVVVDAEGQRRTAATELATMLASIEEQAESDAARMVKLKDQKEHYFTVAKRLEMELRQWRRSRPDPDIGQVPVFLKTSELAGFSDSTEPTLRFADAASPDPQHVAAGTVPGLLGWLISDRRAARPADAPEVFASDFTFEFLFNFRCFSTPVAILESLVAAYCLLPPDFSMLSSRFFDEGLTSAQLAHAKKLFKEFDEDGNGVLSRGELANVLAELQVGCTEADLDVLMKALDTDGSGDIDFPEFYKGVSAITSSKDSAVAQWRRDVRSPLRARILQVLDAWVRLFGYDFKVDADARHLFESFLGPVLQETGALKTGDVMMAFFQEALASYDANANPPASPPLTALLHWDPMDVLHISADELARQLTFVQSRMYGRMRPWEFVEEAHSKAERAFTSPHVSAFIANHNTVSRWVQATVLRVANVRDRAALLRLFIATMGAALALNNYNAAVALYSGLRSSALDRLKRTWAKVPKEHRAELDGYAAVISPERNSRAYREAIAAVEGPAIPAISVYFGQIISASEALDKRTPERLINFERCRLRAGAIAELLRWQPRAGLYITQLGLVSRPEIQAHFAQFYLVEDVLQLQLEFVPPHGWSPTVITDKELFALSLEVEPRVARKAKA